MYSKVLVFLCAAGIASAGNLLHAAPVAYSSAPAVSHVSYSSQTSHSGPYTTYAAGPGLTAYASAPVVAKSYSPTVSYQSYSTHSAPAVATYAAPVVAKTISAPVATYSSAPSVSYQTISSHSAPLTYAAAAPVVTKTYAAPAYSTYAAPAYSTYHATPVVAKTISPALSYSSVSHPAQLTTYAAAAPAYSTYSAVPALKTAVTYSAAPAVSHVSYTGFGASYGW
ncbi:unnamed protein product [Parnassius apollo]|uniref:(apollo) hypothetical protein n=1 Tax=Parnassius apollo TaxID=110799 RepID=A0A8S3XRV2_PARAO|nr:unnamed protein product [Parnassius apollo]